jgi:hypothetical protein
MFNNEGFSRGICHKKKDFSRNGATAQRKPTQRGSALRRCAAA